MAVSGKRKSNPPICLVKDHQRWRTIAYHIDICPKEACNYLLVMTLLSPIREAQKNETSWGLTSLHMKKGNSMWYPSHISPQPTTLSMTLPLCTWKDEEALQNCLGSVQEVGWYLFSTVFIIEPNGCYSIYRCSDLRWISSWLWKYTREKGAAVANSSKCTVHYWQAATSFQSKATEELFVCGGRINKRRFCSADCISQFSQREMLPLDVVFKNG